MDQSEIFREFNETDWRTYYTFSALSSFERFWKDTEQLVRADADQQVKVRGPNWRADTDEEISELLAEIRVVRCVHDEIITPTFRYAAVSMLFALFEREMRRVGDNVAAEVKHAITYRGVRGGHFEHVRKLAKAHLGWDVATLPGYREIHDLQKIRDCLVHCYGDAGLSRDEAYLLKLTSSGIGLDVWSGTEMKSTRNS